MGVKIVIFKKKKEKKKKNLWPLLGHAEILSPRMEPTPQQGPEPQR